MKDFEEKEIDTQEFVRQKSAMALETVIEEESDDGQTPRFNNNKIQPQIMVETARVNEEE